MGSSNWSDDVYADRAAIRAKTGAKTFAYTDNIRSGAAKAAAHATLDPKGIKEVRECRDSEAHPNSNAIAICLDDTGSMGKVPITMQTKLKELMSLLQRKGYIEDPAICISGVGDAEAGDKVPFQVGQFESGIEIENDLTNLYIEGGGGGNNQESYDIFLYFLARMTKTDAFEKRGKKGYAFIICDESLPKRSKASVLNGIFGIAEETDIPIEKLVEEVLTKWELYCIVPNMTSWYKTHLQDSWKAVLGERVIFLDEPEAVVETIATCIGLCEEAIDLSNVVADLSDVGLSADKAQSVSRALAKVSGLTPSTVTKGTGLAVL